MKSPSRNHFLLALLISFLFIHLPLIYLLIKMEGARRDRTAATAPQTVVINIAESKSLPIADLDKPAKEEAPDKASVQSLYNSKVKEETVATGRLKKMPSGTSQIQPKKQVASTTPQTKSLPPVKVQTQPKENLSLQDELKALQNEKQVKEDRNLAKFQTTLRSLGTQNGGASGDFLQGFKIGNHTYLNAQANPSITYFVELKRKFELTWNPVPALRRHLSQISRGEIRVVWGVTVNNQGELTDVLLIRGSGIAGYDSEAHRTITASAPFSRPPANIQEKDGKLYMAWTFVYYM